MRESDWQSKATTRSFDSRRKRFLSLVSMVNELDEPFDDPSLVFRHQGEVCVLPLADLVTVGKAEENTLCIQSGLLSRYHFQIRKAAADEFEIVDLGSEEGTSVNERHVERGRLRSCDKISAAGVELFFFDSGSTSL